MTIGPWRATADGAQNIKTQPKAIHKLPDFFTAGASSMNSSTVTPSDSAGVFRRTWETYTAAWKPENAAQRRSLFEQTLRRDCEYRDPLVHAVGWDALDGYM